MITKVIQSLILIQFVVRAIRNEQSGNINGVIINIGLAICSTILLAA